MKDFLHVGCGQKRKDRTTPGFNTDAWREVRFDINPAVQPDIVGTMTDMSAVADASVDAIYSSHNIEHVYPHEVPAVLAEFLRVLRPGGIAVITCPDLKSVCALVADDKLDEPAYQSPAGPVSPIDILYGHRASMARGDLYMAHRSGFTQKTLVNVLRRAGFGMVGVRERGRSPFFDLWAVASKATITADAMRAVMAEHLPR